MPMFLREQNRHWCRGAAAKTAGVVVLERADWLDLTRPDRPSGVTPLTTRPALEMASRGVFPPSGGGVNP